MDIKQELTDLADHYEHEGEHDHVVKVCQDALAEIERLEAESLKWAVHSMQATPGHALTRIATCVERLTEAALQAIEADKLRTR